MPKVKANGIELHYESFGTGEPLLLIMGIGAQMIQWDEDFCRALAVQGFRVIRFDNRDVGESQILNNLHVPNIRTLMMQKTLGQKVQAPYTLDDMADDTAGLMDALGIDSAHVVGMSLGGMVAQCVALRHPQRVRSLCIMMSSPGDLWTLATHPRALTALTYRAKNKGEQGAVEYQLNLFRMMSAKPHNTPEPRLRELGALHYRRGSHPKGFVRQFAAVLASEGRLRKLHRVRAPTLVIHGARDPLLLPVAGRLIAARIPGARLQIIENMGHDMGPTLWPHVVDAITDNAHRKVSPTDKKIGILKALTQKAIHVSAPRG